MSTTNTYVRHSAYLECIDPGFLVPLVERSPLPSDHRLGALARLHERWRSINRLASIRRVLVSRTWRNHDLVLGGRRVEFVRRDERKGGESQESESHFEDKRRLENLEKGMR